MTVDAPISPTGTNHTLPASPAPSLAPDQDRSSSVLQSFSTFTPPVSAVASAVAPVVAGVKPFDQGPAQLPGTTHSLYASSAPSLHSSSDQVPPQLGPCLGPPAGGPPVALGDPFSLPGPTHTLHASSAPALAPPVTPVVSGVKPVDQVHATSDRARPGPQPGGSSVAAGAPMLLPGTPPTWLASSNPSLSSYS